MHASASRPCNGAEEGDVVVDSSGEGDRLGRAALSLKLIRLIDAIGHLRVIGGRMLPMLSPHSRTIEARALIGTPRETGDSPVKFRVSQRIRAVTSSECSRRHMRRRGVDCNPLSAQQDRAIAKNIPSTHARRRSIRSKGMGVDSGLDRYLNKTCVNSLNQPLIMPSRTNPAVEVEHWLVSLSSCLTPTSRGSRLQG